MRIELNRMELTNFKKAKNVVLEPKGNNYSVYGKNGTGKTTLQDGFLWTLFNKDSEGKTDFEVKTLDEFTGEPFHFLDHSVEIDLTVDGNPMSLKKVLCEKWTKPRGKKEQVFDGHTTDYFIDEVPVKKKDFDDKLSSLIDEELFRLITDPLYFNERLKWQDARSMMLAISGEATVSDIISHTPDLVEFIELLGDKTAEQFQAMLASKRKSINDELKTIPIRIDELVRSMPVAISDEEREAIQAELTAIEKKKHDIENSKTDYKEQLRKFEEEKKKIFGLRSDKMAYENELNSSYNSLASEKLAIEKRLISNRAALEKTSREVKSNKSSIERHELDKMTALVKWKEEKAKLFEFNDTDPCPVCGQDYPEDMVDSKREHALEEFEKTKIKVLERIGNDGKYLASQIERLTGLVEKFVVDAKNLQESIDKDNARLIEINDALINGKIDFTQDAKWIESTKNIDALEALLQQPETPKIDDEIKELDKRVSELQARLSVDKQLETSKKRKEELESQLEMYRDKLMENERLDDLRGRYINVVAELTEGKLNSMFEMVKFKLFEKQINGGINPCFVTTYKGVPYKSMNSAARINCGLDIIKVLSRHNNIYAPIFVDQCESVNKLLPIDAQVVKLVVTDIDDELRMEVN